MFDQIQSLRANMRFDRSSGGDSLSIYTHNLLGISMKLNDSRATAVGGVASVKIFAGEQMRQVYSFGAKNNITIMGGADMNVGVAGWVSGGGHGTCTKRREHYDKF